MENLLLYLHSYGHYQSGTNAIISPIKFHRNFIIDSSNQLRPPVLFSKHILLFIHKFYLLGVGTLLAITIYTLPRQNYSATGQNWRGRHTYQETNNRNCSIIYNLLLMVLEGREYCWVCGRVSNGAIRVISGVRSSQMSCVNIRGLRLFPLAFPV